MRECRKRKQKRRRMYKHEHEGQARHREAKAISASGNPERLTGYSLPPGTRRSEVKTSRGGDGVEWTLSFFSQSRLWIKPPTLNLAQQQTGVRAEAKKSRKGQHGCECRFRKAKGRRFAWGLECSLPLWRRLLTGYLLIVYYLTAGHVN